VELHLTPTGCHFRHGITVLDGTLSDIVTYRADLLIQVLTGPSVS